MKTELSSLKTQLSEKDQEMQKEKNSRTQLQQELSERAEELEKEKQRRTELQQEVEEMQRVERAGRGRAHSFPNINVKPLEDQVSADISSFLSLFKQAYSFHQKNI